MEIIRKTEIIVETKRRFVLQRSGSAAKIFCTKCGEDMLTAEQCAALFAVSRRAVYRLAENGDAEFTENEDGILFLCPDSVARLLENNK